MPAINLTSSTPLKINGVHHTLIGKPDPKKLRLLRTNDQEFIETNLFDLMEKITNGEAEILFLEETDRDKKRRIKDRLRQEISDLKPAARESLDRKLAYVKTLINYMPVPKTKERMQPIILKAAKKINDDNPPHFSTLLNWYNAFIAAKSDPRALIDSHGKKGNQNKRLAPEVYDIITAAIEARYLCGPHGCVEAVYDRVKINIAKANEFRRGPEKLETPNVRTIYREIEKIDPYLRIKKRHGKAAAERLFANVQKAPIATRVLERVEIDHTVLNLFLIDLETGLAIGRPTLTMAIDAYSRMPTGFYVGFEPAGWSSVLHCLRHSVLPKGPTLAQYPDIKTIGPLQVHARL
ncbi:hypothetical protein [Kordiimonas laminariae]|uniref:hypothetical protein n=1 Tax=Kordiimonas laminariae TaxID=2917717 RepID=UPI001FF4DBEF|nr:hypothetical protein [Kordiimonas laminariae]MCK0069413.1 hypothetical protein [Kordiimonas laminariae]